jgi:multiple sugar transport system permease protein
MPFATVILLAGWTAIPKDVHEAAAMDGAGYFRTLFEIQLPMLVPIIPVPMMWTAVFLLTTDSQPAGGIERTDLGR